MHQFRWVERVLAADHSLWVVDLRVDLAAGQLNRQRGGVGVVAVDGQRSGVPCEAAVRSVLDGHRDGPLGAASALQCPHDGERPGARLACSADGEVSISVVTDEDVLGGGVACRDGSEVQARGVAAMSAADR